MHSTTLFLKEIRCNPVGFWISMAAVVAAMASLVGSRGILLSHEREADLLLTRLERRASEGIHQFEEEGRRMSRALGFNIAILPGDQDPGEFFSRDTSSVFFSEIDARALADLRPVTLDHLLPVLRERVEWEELAGTAVLVGFRGEIYSRPTTGDPLETKMAPGTVRLGYMLAQRLRIAPGETVLLRGRPFRVVRTLPSQGNVYDVSLVLNLDDAQGLIGHDGRVSAILALGDISPGGDLGAIRREVQRAIPAAQVVEFSTLTEAGARALDAIRDSAYREVADILSTRETVRQRIAGLSNWLVSLLCVMVCVLLVSLAILLGTNRRAEVLALREKGTPIRNLLVSVLSAAVLLGGGGGLAGSLVGLAVAVRCGGPEAAQLSGSSFWAGIAASALIVAVAAGVTAWVAVLRAPADAPPAA